MEGQLQREEQHNFETAKRIKFFNAQPCIPPHSMLWHALHRPHAAQLVTENTFAATSTSRFLVTHHIHDGFAIALHHHHTSFLAHLTYTTFSQHPHRILQQLQQAIHLHFGRHRPTISLVGGHLSDLLYVTHTPFYTLLYQTLACMGNVDVSLAHCFAGWIAPWNRPFPEWEGFGFVALDVQSGLIVVHANAMVEVPLDHKRPLQTVQSQLMPACGRCGLQSKATYCSSHCAEVQEWGWKCCLCFVNFKSFQEIVGHLQGHAPQQEVPASIQYFLNAA